jgi:hypothetical protein
MKGYFVIREEEKSEYRGFVVSHRKEVVDVNIVNAYELVRPLSSFVSTNFPGCVYLSTRICLPCWMREC